MTAARLARFAVLLMTACARPSGSSTPSGAPPQAPGPRLIVLVVIDQWPEWAFERKRPELTAGFARLLADGDWHVGRHPSAATLTASGHALLGTGEPPAHSGILANEWWHRDLGRTLGSVEGVNGEITDAWLEVPGLGDAIAAAHTGAKAVAVSLKDRAAILPLGHAGLAIWLDPKRGAWTANHPPKWLAAYNTAHPLEPRLDDAWLPLDAARLAALSGIADGAPGEVGEKGLGPTFPHDPHATIAPTEAVFAMPLGDQLVFDTALAAIDGEQLGVHAAPDLLVVSLSAHDYVGHGWGQESWEMWDLDLRLDRQLDDFLAALDHRLGAGGWAMIVTSDHGASPMPEVLGGGRLTHRQLQDAANAAASAVLGPGTWIDNAHYPNVYFSPAMLAQPADELASARKRVINALRAFPGIERVDRVADVAGHCDTRTGEALALCLTFEPTRSGDVFYLPAPGWIMQSEDEPMATAHGSNHDTDRLVPVILLPPGRTRHGAATAPADGEIEMVRIATLLARWLHVTPPIDLPRR